MGGFSLKLFGLILLTMLMMISGCVQPLEPTPTAPPPSPFPTPTPPAALQGSNFSPALIQGWVAANLGVTANNISPFTEQEVGPDHVVGYTFQDAQGQSCVGFVLTTLTTSTIWNGDYQCLPPGTAINVKTSIFALTNGEFYVGVFGYIDPTVVPGAGGVSVLFPDGNTLLHNLAANGYGFVLLRSGLDFPFQLTLSDQFANEITTVPIQ